MWGECVKGVVLGKYHVVDWTKIEGCLFPEKASWKIDNVGILLVIQCDSWVRHNLRYLHCSHSWKLWDDKQTLTSIPRLILRGEDGNDTSVSSSTDWLCIVLSRCISINTWINTAENENKRKLSTMEYCRKWQRTWRSISSCSVRYISPLQHLSTNEKTKPFQCLM